jgi:hypothetical protein
MLPFISPKNFSDDRSMPRHSGMFLPVQWLLEEELREKVEDFRRRIKQAFSTVGEVKHSSESIEKWTIPEWKIVMLEGNVAVL